MYLACLAATLDEEGRLDARAAAAQTHGLGIAHSCVGLRLLRGGTAAPPVRRLDAGVVVGDLFGARLPLNDAPDDLPAGSGPAQPAARLLIDGFWGRYVALLRGPHEPAWSVLRDPSGAVEAFLWRDADLWCVASTLALPAALRPAARIDWDGVAGLLADPVRLSGDLALSGVEALAPGELRELVPGSARRQLWSPAALAERGPIAPEQPRARIQAVVRASARRLARPLAEVSGGFDSSVVAAALAVARGPETCAWLHHHVEEAEADERPFARAAAAHLQLRLRERVKPEARLEPEALVSLGPLARPSLNATDVEYERAMTALLAETGSDGWVTGQGGDAVFLTLRSAWLGADLVQRGGWRRLADPQLLALARWSRTSVWAVQRRAALSSLHLAGPRPRGPNGFASTVARRRARARAPHPWLRDAQRLPPGKRSQVRALAEALVVHGECLRSRAAPLLHPLLSQPVLELCLPIPADILVYDGRDRAWAREVFAQDLAPEVAARRNKGDMTAYYGRMVAAALPGLRPFLLDGVLAAQGLLDRPRLDAALAVERLALDGLYADLMDLTAIEAWARGWPA